MSGFARTLGRGHVRALAIVAVALAAVLPAGMAQAAPSQADCDARPNNTIPKMLECMRVGQVRAHQAALQTIANDNGGTASPAFRATTSRWTTSWTSSRPQAGTSACRSSTTGGDAGGLQDRWSDVDVRRNACVGGTGVEVLGPSHREGDVDRLHLPRRRCSPHS